MMENDHCIATVHAEANAIIQAARNGTSIDKADIYITASPCWNCFKLIANSGIKRIFYLEFYRDERILQVAHQAGIELTQVVLNNDV
jgi:dCMP deaminase